jgi:hypothetical protein
MAVTLKPTVKTLKVVQLLNGATEAQWSATNPVLMANMMCYASDTGVIKIGDGTHTWSETPVYYSQQLVQTVQTYRYVADIAARDALAADQKHGLVIVLDASADPTITTTKKQAGYVWNSTSSAWDKLFEQEAMDIDLTPYFNKNTDTADSINDGTSKVMMLATERTTLATLNTDAVRYTDTIIVSGVNATELAGYYQA